jgi:hypothetical protein
MFIDVCIVFALCSFYNDILLMQYTRVVLSLDYTYTIILFFVSNFHKQETFILKTLQKFILSISEINKILYKELNLNYLDVTCLNW